MLVGFRGERSGLLLAAGGSSQTATNGWQHRGSTNAERSLVTFGRQKSTLVSMTRSRRTTLSLLEFNAAPARKRPARRKDQTINYLNLARARAFMWNWM
jgi:hypothetical protein